MAISIGGTVVIDDSRNIVNVNDIRVGLVTITGSTGNIETPGTITGGGFGVAGTGFSVSPGIGATNVDPQKIGSIILSFPTSVTRGTGTITLRTDSAGGTIVKSYNAATAPEITVLNNTWAVSVATTFSGAIPAVPFDKQIFLVVPSTAISGFVGLNTTGADSYSFTTPQGGLGGNFGGGFLICKAFPLRWVVSPYGAEVSRCWDLRGDSNTRSQQVSGCTGWFVPTLSKLQNPGYLCRSFWGASPCYSQHDYWTDTPAPAPESPGCASSMYMCNGPTGGQRHAGANSYKVQVKCVRSFRCVTY